MRYIGLKQDSMVYKVRIVRYSSHGDVKKVEEAGPYDTRGAAAQVGSSVVNRINGYRVPGEGSDYAVYQVIPGRNVWFQENK